MVDVTASLDAATQQSLALLAQLRLGNIRGVQVQDIGAADNCLFAPVPNVTSYGPDLVLLADIAAPNATTTPRLAIQGLSSVPIQDAIGGAPVVGTVAGKRIFGFSSVAGGGFAARLIGLALADILPVVLANAPQILTVGPTIYVNPNTGNDANPGTAGAPVQSLAGAFALAARLIVIGALITVKLAVPGTYAAAVPPSGLVSAINVLGDTNNQDAYVVSGAGVSTGVLAHLQGNISYTGVRLTNSGNVTNLLAAAYGGVVTASYTTFAASGTNNTAAAMTAFPGGTITLGPGCKVVSNFGSLMTAIDNGTITLQQGATFTAAGGPAFVNATAVASNGGRIDLAGSTFAGAASGARYSATSGGGINTSGGGANFIFGSTAGSSTTGYYT